MVEDGSFSGIVETSQDGIAGPTNKGELSVIKIASKMTPIRQPKANVKTCGRLADVGP